MKDYFSIVILICIAFCVANVFLVKNLLAFAILAGAVISFTSFYVLKLFTNRYATYATFILVIGLVFYFALNRQLLFLNLFHVNIVLAIFFVYEWQKNFREIVSLLTMIAIAASLILFTDILHSGAKFTVFQYNLIYYLSLLFFSLLLFVNIRFIVKNKEILEWYVEQYSLSINIKDRIVDQVSIEDISKLKIELFENYHGFLTHFQRLFPRYYTRIKELDNITVSDIEILSLIKLQFTTNEIAQITNLTLKSVESKKYRLRKKFNIPSSEDLYLWTDNL